MAFPQVVATNNSVEGTNTTSHAVNLPAGIQAGETLLVFFAQDGISTTTLPGGWTELFRITNGSATALTIGWRKADGGEGATITITTGFGQESAHITHRISGAPDPTVTAPEASTGATGSSVNPDPDSLTASGGSKEYLWIVAAGSDDGADLFTAYPTNFPDNRETYQSAESSGGCNVAVATRDIETSVQNPGTFTIENSEQWVACTVAVYPAEIVGWVGGDLNSVDIGTVAEINDVALADIAEINSVA